MSGSIVPPAPPTLPNPYLMAAMQQNLLQQQAYAQGLQPAPPVPTPAQIPQSLPGIAGQGMMGSAMSGGAVPGPLTMPALGPGATLQGPENNVAVPPPTHFSGAPGGLNAPGGAHPFGNKPPSYGSGAPSNSNQSDNLLTPQMIKLLRGVLGIPTQGIL